ncbi:MAG: xanthine dehydrogenase family protein molybdopterin-binding subunit [Dehalococcoidia bacterium]|nr:xanthine dehydrogenase family protein molybdopterin-binding subunit [Dehalococcoidia bacterium]
MTTTADRSATPAKYKVIGTRPIRHDGYEKVTGRARYGADVHLPGMLHGAFARSPHAHARIVRIDTSKAAAVPGVKAVITAKDLPVMANAVDWGNTAANARMLAETALAYGKALYRGQAVAAVAAISPHIAMEAAKLVEVEYEVLTPVLDVREAMRPDAPVIHETMTTRDIPSRFERGKDTGARGNIASHMQLKRGDVEQAFAQAAVVVEREFTTKMVHQGYIEPHASTAYWSPDGSVTIWASSQGHFGIRDQVAEIIKVPESLIKVIPMEIGGGFGGKVYTWFDAVAAVLSKKTGHPVKIVVNRREEFEGGMPASGCFIRMKMGADKNGTITAVQGWMAYEAGAFSGSPMGAGVVTGLSPYKIENILVDGYDVIVNKPKVGAYRAPGSPQAAMAVESVVDELAERLKMDPLDLRLRNAPKQGDRAPTGVPFPRIGCIEVLEAMRAHPHYKSALTGKHRGRGVAIGFWYNGGLASSATLSVNSDGRVSLVTGSVDIGGSRPVMAMHAAEVLGIEALDVIPSVGDTSSVGWTGTTGGSRTAMTTGTAVVEAARKIQQEMAKRAAILWEVRPEDVRVEDGAYVNAKSGERFTFKQVAAKTLATGGPVTASASFTMRQQAPAYAGNIVDVEVDADTGKVTILRYTVVEDVGTAVHPSYVEGQMQGGTVQGIGWALNEEYAWGKDGGMQNASFLDYRMPTALDVPMIETVMVEVPNPAQPFGVRGVGEVSIVPPLAALANAIHKATRARLTDLPMSPGAILQAMQGQQK